MLQRYPSCVEFVDFQSLTRHNHCAIPAESGDKSLPETSAPQSAGGERDGAEQCSGSRIGRTVKLCDVGGRSGMRPSVTALPLISLGNAPFSHCSALVTSLEKQRHPEMR